MTQLHTHKLWDMLHSDVSSQAVLSNIPSLKDSTLTEVSQTLLRRGSPLPLMEDRGVVHKHPLPEHYYHQYSSITGYKKHQRDVLFTGETLEHLALTPILLPDSQRGWQTRWRQQAAFCSQLSAPVLPLPLDRMHSLLSFSWTTPQN